MKIAIIGAGNMGGAIARGLAKGSKFKAEEIFVSDVSEKNLEALKALSIQTSTSNRSIVQGADLVLIAVKPWLVEKVAAEIADLLDPSSQKLVSIAAGVDLNKLSVLFGSDLTIFRMIPNTAIEILQSVNTVCAFNANGDDEAEIESIFSELGKVFIVPESQLNAFMSLSSCGIAYAFRYIRAAMEAGVEMGVYPQVAKEVVLQTLKGAVELIEANNSHPEAEIDKVTTPGGITIRGLNEMEAQGFTNSIIKGLKASHLG